MRKKIVFIGNSIVAGYPWSKGKSFASVIRRTLSGSGELPAPDYAASTGFDILNKGVNGDTTSGIAERFDRDVLAQNPDIVFFMTGTNDFIYRDASPQEAFDNLEALARRGDAAEIRSVYMTPLPVDAGKAGYMWLAGCGVSYDAVNREIETFSALIRESGRPFVDMNRLFRNYIEQTGDPDLAYMDGIHPMPDGHIFIAQQVLAFMDRSRSALGLA